MSTSNLIRWSGMAAMLGGTLFVIATLVGLFVPLAFFDPGTPPSQATVTAFSIITSFSALLGESLLVLGLVGLYVRQSRSTGALGFISFLLTFFGLVAILASLPWSDLLVTLGWTLFGVGSLQAGIYPRPACILLIFGAVSTGMVSMLLPVLGGSVWDFVGLGCTTVLNGALAWLGFNLFTGRGISATR